MSMTVGEARAIVRAYVVIYAPDKVLEAFNVIDVYLGYREAKRPTSIRAMIDKE